METLLEETLSCMHNKKLSEQDIIFIGSRDGEYACSFEEFKVLADRKYDSSYGSRWVAVDLIIVFRSGHILEREEYEGSEWWRVVKPFTLPTASKPIHNLFGCYKSIRDLQEEGEEDKDLLEEEDWD
jgi:hypothetical protein